MTHRDLQRLSDKSPRAVSAAEGATDKENPLAAPSTIQGTCPQICGACQCPVAPYRFAGNRWPTYGRQCNCPTPESPMPAHDNALRGICRDESTLEVPERIDIQARRIPPEILEEFGVSRVHQIAGHVDDARRELMEALKLADRTDLRDVHVEVGEIVNRIDDLRVGMAKRGESE